MEKSFIIVNTSTGSFLIEFKTIVRIEAVSNYSKIYFNVTLGGMKSLVTAKVLKWFEERLPNESFTRLHRSHLVNNKFLQTQRLSNKGLELQNGKVIEIARRRRKSVMMKFFLQKQCLVSIASEAECIAS